jgi:hypothetical protein
MWLLSIDDRDVGKLAKLYAKRANRENNLTILFHSILIQTVCSVPYYYRSIWLILVHQSYQRETIYP